MSETCTAFCASRHAEKARPYWLFRAFWNELDSLVGATYISHPRKGSEFFQASVVRASALPDGEGVAKRVDGSQKNGETEISVSGRRF